MSHHKTLVGMRGTKKMMKLQPTTSLRYLASRVDGGQDDVVVPIRCFHPGALQRGSVGVVEVPRLPVQLLGRSSLRPPPERPYAFGAIDEQPAGGAGAVVGREGRHSGRDFAQADIRRAPAEGWGGGIVVGGGGLVGGPVDEALETGLG